MLKQKSIIQYLRYLKAATFGWLCVETYIDVLEKRSQSEQPPSGGCVLKPISVNLSKPFSMQPPSGGCVLKQILIERLD